MQLLDVVVYSHAGEARLITFRPGALNVITGESGSGKSALVEVVRYCLGSEDYRVPAGVIAQSAAWYGLRVQLTSGQAFIGRPAPAQGQAATSAAMLTLGSEVGVPGFGALAPNTNTATVVRELSNALGIEENLAALPPHASRPPVEANLHHALIFCLQRQGEIASQEQLFHRQSDSFVASAIRDTLPYFLGAVSSDYVVQQDRLRRLRVAIRRAEARLGSFEQYRDVARNEAIVLLNQSYEVGLLRARNWPEDGEVGDFQQLLSDAVRASPDDGEASDLGGRAWDALQRERSELAQRYRDVERTRLLTERLLRDQAFYTETLTHYREHMEVADFVPTEELVTCPVCEQPAPTGAATVEELRSALTTLRASVSDAARDEPRLRRLQAGVADDQALLRERLATLDASLDALAREHEEVERLSTRINEQSYVRGRIDFYLQRAAESDDSNIDALRREIAELRTREDELEAAIGYEAVRERVTSILNAIGRDMQTWAQRLELGHSTNTVRIDLRALTVVADTPSGPIPLTRMGSAANWVGYHLVAHLALHKFFVEQNRPVPRFLLLDQLTQAFYPPHQSNREREPLSDADRAAVERMFSLLRDFAEEMSPHVQVIVMEHENPDREGLESVVVEEWRHGRRLIPRSWYSGEPEGQP